MSKWVLLLFVVEFSIGAFIGMYKREGWMVLYFIGGAILNLGLFLSYR